MQNDADLVPVLTILSSFYNAENFMPKCVDMLKAQTLRDFRVILVDDGSTDCSYKKCVEAVGTDSRFTVIRHEKNMGLGSGRITGIENCKTEYLTYIDSDDYLEPNAVENYLIDIQRTKADYIVYDYFMFDGHNKILVTDDSVNTDELFKSKSPLISHVWHKVVKKSLYKQFDYSFLSKVSFAEDLFNSVNCFFYAKKVAIIHKAYYTYMYNVSSSVHNRTKNSIMENIAVNKNLLLDSKFSEMPNIKKYIEDDCFHAFGQLIFPNLKNDFQKKPHFKEWRNCINECSFPIPKDTSFFVRLYVFFIKHNFLYVSSIFFFVLKIKLLIKSSKLKK